MLEIWKINHGIVIKNTVFWSAAYVISFSMYALPFSNCLSPYAVSLLDTDLIMSRY